MTTPTPAEIAAHIEAGGFYQWNHQGEWLPGRRTADDWRNEPYQDKPCEGWRLV